MTDRPKFTCEHCGDEAFATLGGEHIHKCSDVIQTDALQELAEGWRELANKDVDTVPAQACNDMARACANELEELIND